MGTGAPRPSATGRAGGALTAVDTVRARPVALPPGFGIALDGGARQVGDGTVLVGGSPIRLLRLTPSGRNLVDRLGGGEPVPPSPAAQSLTRRLLDAGLAHPRPPAPATPPDVAVVIPVRNDTAGLAATLAALKPGPAVVVDDDSDEPSPVAGVCSPHGATLIRRTARGGPGAARNTGWRATTGEFVAFVDANCEPEPGWLDRLLPHFVDPMVAAVAPRILPGGGPAAPGWLAAYEEASSPLDLGTREAVVRPRWWCGAASSRRSAGSTRRSLSARTSTSSGGSSPPGGPSATNPGRPCAIRSGPRGGRAWRSATATVRRPRHSPAGTVRPSPPPSSPPGPPPPGAWWPPAGPSSAPPSPVVRSPRSPAACPAPTTPAAPP